MGFYGPAGLHDAISMTSSNIITFGKGSDSTEFARFDANGKFGIGTNNPLYPLHVYGRIATTAGDFFINNSEPTMRLSNNYVTPHAFNLESGSTPGMGIFSERIFIIKKIVEVIGIR